MKKIFILSLYAFIIPSFSLFASNGAYRVGFGVSKGIGGAAVALPQDTLSAMTNPANLVPVGNRIDANIEYFRGTRIGKIRGNLLPPPFAVNRDYDLSRSKNLLDGEAGISWSFLDNRLGFGILVAPQSGGVIKWNTFEPFDPANRHDFHINVAYLAITPTIAGEIFSNDIIGKHYVGLGVDLTPARLKITGLQSLQNVGGIFGATIDPNHVTNKGWDWAFGGAVRVGYLVQIREWIAVGIAYRSKTWMTRFDRYRGVISPHGRADLPATLFGGFAIKPFRQTTIAIDIGRIYNGGVKAFANKTYDIATAQVPHGASNGAAFEWSSSTVYKIGIVQQIAQALTLRAGYNYGQLPWQSTDVYDNALAALFLPATMRHHLTFGATLALGEGMINASLVYGFKHSIHGPLTPALPPPVGLPSGGKVEVSSDLITFEVGISKVW